MYPNVVAMKVMATTKDGRVIEFVPRDPLGHTHNPTKDQDVRDKFKRTVEPVYGRAKTSTVLERWWRTKEFSAAEMTGALSLLDIKT